MRSRFRYLLIVVCLFAASAVHAEKEQTFHFLTVADIHFTPFMTCRDKHPCPLIKQLQAVSVEKWPAILEKEEAGMPHYRQDTNFSLLVSALQTAKNAAKTDNAKFVIVLGDFLGHEYRRYYVKYTGDKTAAGYQAFVKKTMTFLTNELAETFPSLPIYNVIGNNDSYQADYSADPHGEFFHDTSYLWSNLLRDKINRADMQRIFPVAGYYALTLPQDHLRLIVLNSVLFSDRAKGRRMQEAAEEELNWLHQELLSVKVHHQKALIAMHIPVSIDVYATIHYRLFRLMELWQTPYIERYEAELQQFAPEIAGVLVGHLHTGWFQMLTFNNTDQLPITGTPSISPVFGNSPGFKIYTYSSDSRQIENFHIYYYSLSQNTWNVTTSDD